MKTVPVERLCHPSAEPCDFSRPGEGAGLHLGFGSHRDSAVPASSHITDIPGHGASGMFRDVCKYYPFIDGKFRDRKEPHHFTWVKTMWTSVFLVTFVCGTDRRAGTRCEGRGWGEAGGTGSHCMRMDLGRQPTALGQTIHVKEPKHVILAIMFFSAFQKS